MLLRCGLCFPVDCSGCDEVFLRERFSSVSCGAVDRNAAEKDKFVYAGGCSAACKLYGTFDIDRKIQIVLTLLSAPRFVRTSGKMYNCAHPIKCGLPISRWPQFET